MAPPMGPVAPVTSAVFPVSSNISPPRPPLAASPWRASNSSAEGGLEPGNVVRNADCRRGRRLGNTLDQPGQHLAGADLVERRYTRLRHEMNRLPPANRAGDLRD